MTTERALPHSVQLEQYALGAFLAGATGSECVLDLHTEHFFIDAHRKIFTAILAVRERGDTADLLSVHEELLKRSGLEAVGGIAYLAGLTDGIPRIAPVAQWARTVREFALRREIIAQAEALQQRAFEGDQDAPALLDSGIEVLSGMARDLESVTDEGISYRDAAVGLLNDLRDAARPRLFTGLDSLDRVIGGFLPGELWVIAAATGTGKTVLAQQTRRRACVGGHHVLYASGEMDEKHLQARELAGAAHVPQGKMRHPEKITEVEFSRLVESAAVQCTVCKIIGGDLDLGRIRRTARRMKARTGLSLIVLDYDELISVKDSETEMEQLRLLARAAKSLALELDCAVILISQLRKALEGEDLKRPTLQLIYGSGAKTKFATGVLIAHRPYVQTLDGDEAEAVLFILKNRDGRLGRIDCRFDVQKLEFLDPASAFDTFAQVSDGKARASGGDR
jgi:replicative DNA helicase